MLEEQHYARKHISAVVATLREGLDGVLVVDMPPEEAEEFGPLLKARDLAAIFLVAPTTSHARAATICAHGEGYLYYVSLKGVTGAATLNAEDVAEHLAPLRDMTDLPLCVGFGIRDGVTAAEVAKVADGVANYLTNSEMWGSKGIRGTGDYSDSDCDSDD